MPDAEKNSPSEGTPVASAAAGLGVPVAAVEELLSTACVAGEDFTDIGGEPHLTAAGLEKIRTRLAEQMTTTPPPAPEAKPAAAATEKLPERARETLKLTRVFPWSTNILAVRENGLEVVVAVKNASHLKPGMELQDCIEGDTGWFYQGRLPRIFGEEQLYYPARKSAGGKKPKKP